MTRQPAWTWALGLLGGVTVLGAQSGELRMTPAEIKWSGPAAGATGTSGVAGIQTVVAAATRSRRTRVTSR
jgi:hypothetical protein